ncbi:MAG: NepR family anti-sigma factor [Pseudomonadota bacterium]
MFDDMTQDQNSSKAQAEIDANLRRAYDEVTQQEVPDRFKELIKKLRAEEASSAANDSWSDDGGEGSYEGQD